LSQRFQAVNRPKRWPFGISIVIIYLVIAGIRLAMGQDQTRVALITGGAIGFIALVAFAQWFTRKVLWLEIGPESLRLKTLLGVNEVRFDRVVRWTDRKEHRRDLVLRTKSGHEVVELLLFERPGLIHRELVDRLTAAGAPRLQNSDWRRAPLSGLPMIWTAAGVVAGLVFLISLAVAVISSRALPALLITMALTLAVSLYAFHVSLGSVRIREGVLERQAWGRVKGIPLEGGVSLEPRISSYPRIRVSQGKRVIPLPMACDGFADLLAVLLDHAPEVGGDPDWRAVTQAIEADS
jgi:hypothetical protein